MPDKLIAEAIKTAVSQSKQSNELADFLISWFDAEKTGNDDGNQTQTRLERIYETTQVEDDSLADNSIGKYKSDDALNTRQDKKRLLKKVLDRVKSEE